jgi:ABC-type transport system involved in multi-copper enzyme maturation permease subunit
MRLGLGPVFEVEWLTTSRRWQMYAVRSFFVASILVGMMIVWAGREHSRATSARALAAVGESLFYVIVGTQLALVLLAAPAATAGSICLDKARGTLVHLLVTDLSDSEIILGKLAARLIPVFGFIMCVLPVIAMSTMLGGVDPAALLGAFVVTLAVGALGCALAMVLSVWGSKTHEVLMGTYTVWAIWLLGRHMYDAVVYQLFGPGSAFWPRYLDPFWMVFAPYEERTVFWLPWQFLYASVVFLLAGALTALAILRVRAVTVRQWGRQERASKRSKKSVAPLPVRRWGIRLVPTPSLDLNPVLWREWHRKLPSRWMRAIWALYFGIATIFSAMVIVGSLSQFGQWQGEFGALVNAFGVSIGLLFVAVLGPTCLAEERIRGSLDVLMATPLSTWSIVWGKWWGTYRTVAWLAVLPFLTAFVLSAQYPQRAVVAFLMLGLILTYGAALTSLGLALATWLSRLGRALALTVSIHVFLTVAVPLIGMTVSDGSRDSIIFSMIMVSSFWGPGLLTVSLEQRNFDHFQSLVFGGIFWIHFCAAASAVLLIATARMFDRRMGRISELPSPPVRNPRLATAPAPALAD